MLACTAVQPSGRGGMVVWVGGFCSAQPVPSCTHFVYNFLCRPIHCAPARALVFPRRRRRLVRFRVPAERPSLAQGGSCAPCRCRHRDRPGRGNCEANASRPPAAPPSDLQPRRVSRRLRQADSAPARKRVQASSTALLPPWISTPAAATGCRGRSPNRNGRASTSLSIRSTTRPGRWCPRASTRDEVRG